MAVLGLLDDFYPIHAMIKLFVFIGVTIGLTLLGISIDLPFLWAPINMLLTLVWIVGMISAFNAIDNSDGVAVGKQNRISRLIRFNGHLKEGHDVRTIGKVGDLAKSFRLALGNEKFTGRIEAFQGSVLLRFDGVANLYRAW